MMSGANPVYMSVYVCSVGPTLRSQQPALLLRTPRFRKAPGSRESESHFYRASLINDNQLRTAHCK